MENLENCEDYVVLTSNLRKFTLEIIQDGEDAEEEEAIIIDEDTSNDPISSLNLDDASEHIPTQEEVKDSIRKTSSFRSATTFELSEGDETWKMKEWWDESFGGKV